MQSNYFTLKKLTGPQQNTAESTFKKMEAALQSGEIAGKFQFQILKGDEPSFFYFDARKTGAKLNLKKADKPDFEIITTEETWLQIANGVLSPLRAFLENKMRVRGKVELGEMFLKQFSKSENTKK